jgi:DNA-binding NtrC family response regulator
VSLPAVALAFVEEGELEQPSLDALPLGGHRLDSLERAAIRQTLAQTGGNKVRTARTLGIAASTLYEKLKKYNLY